MPCVQVLFGPKSYQVGGALEKMAANTLLAWALREEPRDGSEERALLLRCVNLADSAVDTLEARVVAGVLT